MSEWKAEWQPIETAPKDGTEILAYRSDCGVFMIRWTSPDAFLSEKEIAASRLSDDDLFTEGWYFADWLHGDLLMDREIPTHWMPLPPPPKSDK